MSIITIIFVLIIAVGLPVIALFYAFYKKRYVPFLLGVVAFVVSQMILRIPLLHYIGQHSVAYSMLQATKPVLFAVAIGLSAGVFEELARFVLMRFFMKQRDWLSGFLFGAGHGGVEAVLLVGVNVIILLFSQEIILNGTYFISGVERFFAIILHVGLSIIVLQGVVQKKFMYVVLAIVIHGAIDALVGIVPLFVPPSSVIITLEASLAVTAIAVLIYSLHIKRKGVLQ